MTATRTLLPSLGLLALVLGAAPLWAGCASAGMPAPLSKEPPASPAEGRTELNELEEQIARDRVALGLPPRVAEPQPDRSADSESLEETRTAEAPPPAAPARGRVEPQGMPVQTTDDEKTCPADPCRYTRAICDAAGRICQIARYLADAESRSRCSRAQRDCGEARRSTQDSCSGC